MYTLRKIFKDGVEANIALGNSYNFVTKERSEEEFTKIAKITFDTETEEERIYAFITSEGGKEFYPLFTNQLNFIMTDSGRTFANLTHK